MTSNPRLATSFSEYYKARALADAKSSDAHNSGWAYDVREISRNRYVVAVFDTVPTSEHAPEKLLGYL